ncbi:replication initiation protein [Vagococcus carniphilus]|uniref:replication initiation protein n=1 Tax=Vagococcus carniphilus TaxID=218144 RepID=UPI00288F8497|nr:replication initiation protein [Vagococcus carniphilus]MDT2866483.1 replication initiation protein [Vagococcus carniphilus]
MNELTVKYKNELNTIPMRKFNAKEMDLFFSICAKMKNKSTNTVRFEFEDLRGLSDYKMTATNHFVKDLDNVYTKMLGLNYREEDDTKIKRFVLFTDFEIDKEEKYVEISVNQKLEYILNQLSSEFTQFELQEFTSLSSSYSKTMYRLLKQFKSTGFYTVKMDEFRELLDIPNSYKMGNIDQQILNPIRKELSQYFEPFKIKKIKAKKGNRIDRLEFLFQEKQHEEELPRIPMYNWLKN